VKKVFYIYFLIPALALVCIVCSKQEKLLPVNSNTTITLRWVKAYDNETKNKVETGLKWALLFLGAGLPSGSYEQAVTWKSADKMDIDFSKLGFSKEGLDALAKLITEMKKSGEYTEKGGIDIGRFIILTVSSPYHYYAITNAPKTFDEYKNKLRFDNKKAGIVESNIAFGQREIDVPDPSSTDILKHGFAASEGSGKITDGSFKINEHEVFDIMPNGMFRFMLYDDEGKLKPAGDISLGGAGKPSNCLWCHEIGIQPAFISKTAVNGYYSPEEYEKIITKQLDLLKSYRNNLKQDIDYAKTLDHTFTEILYISFMEPSAERLANEWGIPVEQVREKLKGLPTHTHHEFPYLGTLYNRKDVEKLNPYNVIQVPESAREHSEYEPDLIK
jgi:hypothetical protein